MALLVKLVYDASAVRARYRRVHTGVFGFSLPKMLRSLASHSPRELGRFESELDALLRELAQIRETVRGLPAADLTKRTGPEIRATLIEYTNALASSIDKLKAICTKQRLEHEGDPGYRDYSTSGYWRDRVAYDDALQHHRRVAARLNQLLSTF